MADIKISQLGAAIAVSDSDLVPIVSSGSTLKASASLVKEYAVGNTDLTGLGDGTPTGAIAALNTAKQPKTLDTPLTIGGAQKTTVEAALGGLNSESESFKQALSTTNNVLGAKNLFHNTATTTVVTGVTYTVNPDGSITLTGTQATSPKSHLKIYNDVDVPKGTYILTGANGEDTQIALYNVTSGSAVGIGSDFGSGFEFTLSSDAKLRIDCYTFSAHGNYNETIYPMIRPASITDDTYVPYAMTNRELTQDLTTTSNSLADVKNGNITSYFKAVNTTCNVYMTSNTNFDWNNISQQDATDIAQALYDLFKKVGGSQLIVYEGMCSLVFRKASDGSAFGSFNGIIRIISNDPYTDMLAHNDHARLRVVYEQYGDPVTYDFGIWGDKITICAYGKNHVNTSFNVQSVFTYNTISTYKG